MLVHMFYQLSKTKLGFSTTSRSTFATLIYNTCNKPRKHLKHLKHTIATCAFSVAFACCLDEWRLVDAELDAGMELEAAEWHGGRRCGAHRRHGPRQGQGQAGGAWRERGRRHTARFC